MNYRAYAFLATLFSVLNTGCAQEVKTPNAIKVEKPGDRVDQILQSQGYKPTTRFSASATMPMPVKQSSIQAENEVKDRFTSFSGMAQAQGFRSYLQVETIDGWPAAGCQRQGGYPRGVRRISDELLNGYSVLLSCGDYWMEVTISDFSYDTSPTMQVSLPDERVPIAGGYLSSSFVNDASGRVRQEYDAIGGKVAVDVVLQSSKPVSQTEARWQAVSLIEYLLANPPKHTPPK